MIRTATAALLAFASSAALAKTIDVPAGPNAQERLQEALLDARPGDTVQIGPGRFELLASGCSLDLHPRAWRSGMCAQTLFAKAQVILHERAETTGMLGRQHFAAMKRGATFINTARGGLVRETELAQVLRERPDLFAVLDVSDPEPPAANSVLFGLKNVVLTPHIAGSMGPECRRLGAMMVDEVGRYLTGKPLLGEVQQRQLSVIA